jgi:uncharacterized protein (TIGR02001 family)
MALKLHHSLQCRVFVVGFTISTLLYATRLQAQSDIYSSPRPLLITDSSQTLKATETNSPEQPSLSVATETAATEVVSPWASSVGVYSQYVSRGVSYTSERPALQATTQYTFPSGWYLGFWVSNVSNDTIHNGHLESDPYGGYSNTIGDVSYDLGFWRWTFIGAFEANSRQKYDTLEAYAGLTWKMFNLKYWREITDYFGVNAQAAGPDLGMTPNGSSKGSHYLEGNVNIELSHGFSMILHAGRQEVSNYPFYNFNEYRIELDKDLGDNYLVSLAYGDTSANPLAYVDSKGVNGGRGKWIAFIKKSF